MKCKSDLLCLYSSRLSTEGKSPEREGGCGPTSYSPPAPSPPAPSPASHSPKELGAVAHACNPSYLGG
jgi:hypothetical protein